MTPHLLKCDLKVLRKTRFWVTSQNEDLVLFVSLYQNVILGAWKFKMMLNSLL